MTTQDTSSFFTTHQSRDVPRDQWGRYKLPGPDGTEESWTRATTLAATMAEQYGLSIWKQRQVVWGLSRRPDLMTMAQTIAGPEDKKALGAIVDEAHIAAGTQAKANRGTAIHSACHAAERGAYDQVPEELRPHVAGYFSELKRQQLQVIPEYVERTVIVPDYQTAGTFDNLLRCPDGRIRVGDKKTGRMDYSDIEFAIQMALYANASALFNYDTGQYEPMPEIAKDYAILMVIDPETGHCEAQRINIAWGWMWARTAFEVMAIRKTKAVITPLIPPEVDDTLEPLMRDLPGPGAPIPVHEVKSAIAAMDAVHTEALMGSGTGEPQGLRNTASVFGQPLPDYAPPSQAVADARRAMTADFGADPATYPGTSPLDQVVADMGTMPGGYVDSTSPVAAEYQAFWSDDRHDFEPDATVNGVPLEQYGQPSPWGCSRGEPCEFTGDSGLHSDGTVCLYGNARTGPIPPMPLKISPEGAAMAAEVGGYTITDLDVNRNPGHIPPDANPDSGEPRQPDGEIVDPDDLVAQIDGLKGGKAMVQNVARRLMEKVGEPDAIKLQQYKVKIARACVDLAHKHGVSIPGPKDGDPDFGVPSGPAPAESASGADAAAQKAKGDAGATGVPAQQPDGQRDEKIRTAVRSIAACTSIGQLQKVHEHYAGTSIGWTDEMQSAARTRAAELELASGESPLSPLEMIQGATSRETLTKAWQIATAEGGGGWTEELNAAAMAKETELAQRAGVAPSGNQ